MFLCIVSDAESLLVLEQATDLDELNTAIDTVLTSDWATGIDGQVGNKLSEQNRTGILIIWFCNRDMTMSESGSVLMGLLVHQRNTPLRLL